MENEYCVGPAPTPSVIWDGMMSQVKTFLENSGKEKFWLTKLARIEIKTYPPRSEKLAFKESEASLSEVLEYLREKGEVEKSCCGSNMEPYCEISTDHKRFIEIKVKQGLRG